MSKIVLFASGNGSNVFRICEYFKDNPKVKIERLFCNNSKAGVLRVIEPYGIKAEIFSRSQLHEGELMGKLNLISPKLIVLAGFLLKIPENIVTKYKQKIVNIHPSLLPKFGGKGMYGINVHQAVKDSGDSKTGISIHWVDNQYDSGDIIFQKSVEINPEETPEQIAQKVLKLEHYYYPSVIHALVEDLPYDW
ncbi:MAG: phosphoribosylglycinamide formyltransferase [Flavobacteriaceae bacterium]|nr:phosphoribosylglycinamide formyltransferase [Flavobacteriaceae bacterium]